MVWKPDYMTVAQFNSYGRIGDTVDDVETALWITAASRAIDDHCHRQFGQAIGVVARVYRRPAFYDERTALYCVDIDDVQDTTGMLVAGVALASSGAVLLPDNAPLDGHPYVRLGFVDCPADGPLTVTLRPGWTAVPAQVAGACRLQVNRFSNRRESPLGVTEAPEGGTAVSLRSRLDPDIAVALRGLGRGEWPQ